MGIKTAYKGYTAYDYLTPGVDYPNFKLAKWDWAGRYLLPLSESEEQRVLRLAKDNIFIALHEHPNFTPENIDELPALESAGRESCAYEALSFSYLDCVFDNMMDGTCHIVSANGWKWEDILIDLGQRLCDLHHQDFLFQCYGVEDIYRAHREGKIGWVPVPECAAPMENELDRIDVLYGLGVRMMGVTYSESNPLGSGIKEDNDGGLTKFGKQAVRRMNKVGMLIDCSHSGPKTTLDTIDYSEKPIILSHVGARKLWESKRLCNDDVLKACAEHGGVVGIEAAPHTTMTKTHMTHDLEAYMEHFEYCANLVGIDHVSFGTDGLFGDHVGLHHLFAKSLATGETHNQTLPYQEVPYVKGLENPTEASWNILRWLVKHGYSDEDIAKVIGLNTLRVLKEVW